MRPHTLRYPCRLHSGERPPPPADNLIHPLVANTPLLTAAVLSIFACPALDPSSSHAPVNSSCASRPSPVSTSGVAVTAMAAGACMSPPASASCTLRSIRPAQRPPWTAGALCAHAASHRSMLPTRPSSPRTGRGGSRTAVAAGVWQHDAAKRSREAAGRAHADTATTSTFPQLPCMPSQAATQHSTRSECSTEVSRGTLPPLHGSPRLVCTLPPEVAARPLPPLPPLPAAAPPLPAHACHGTPSASQTACPLPRPRAPPCVQPPPPQEESEPPPGHSCASLRARGAEEAPCDDVPASDIWSGLVRCGVNQTCSVQGAIGAVVDTLTAAFLGRLSPASFKSACNQMTGHLDDLLFATFAPAVNASERIPAGGPAPPGAEAELYYGGVTEAMACLLPALQKRLLHGPSRPQHAVRARLPSP